MNTIWHEEFLTGELSVETYESAESGSDKAKAYACAKALAAWGLCMSGESPPEKFGNGMIALANWSGLSVDDLLPENAGDVADKALERLRLENDKCERYYKKSNKPV